MGVGSGVTNTEEAEKKRKVDWEEAEKKRKVDWEKEFLAHQTWLNLRLSVRGFFGYTRYVLKADREMNQSERTVWFITPLHSNTSNLEGLFSIQRMRKCENAQTYASGLTRAANNPKIAKTAARNSGAYNFDHLEDSARVQLSEMQIEKKINACEQQATMWMSKTKVIAEALPVSTGKAIQFSLLEMPSKAVLSSSIRDRLRKKLMTNFPVFPMDSLGSRLSLP